MIVLRSLQSFNYLIELIADIIVIEMRVI